MNVENKVSTRMKTTTLAQWRLNEGRYAVVLHLTGCWNEAVEIVNRAIEQDPDFKITLEEFEEAFCDSLAASYLIERICIERHHEKIRLKHDHCKPCCIERIMVIMHNHVHNVFTYHLNPEQNDT